jgi:hypothetical protein
MQRVVADAEAFPGGRPGRRTPREGLPHATHHPGRGLGPDLRDRTESKSDKGDLVLLSRGSGGKDSPQVATRLSQTDTVSTWSVASGGRMGGVLGEDAVELSAGATSCVQDCQAQNRIRGSLPVTDPAFSG